MVSIKNFLMIDLSIYFKIHRDRLYQLLNIEEVDRPIPQPAV